MSTSETKKCLKTSTSVFCDSKSFHKDFQTYEIVRVENEELHKLTVI